MITNKKIKDENKYCLNCGKELTPIGAVGIKANYKCDKCNLYYQDKEPVAYQVGNIITPLDL